VDVKDELIRLLRRLEKIDNKKQSHENVRTRLLFYIVSSVLLTMRNGEVRNFIMVKN